MALSGGRSALERERDTCIEKGLDFIWDSCFMSQSTDGNYPGDERRERWKLLNLDAGAGVFARRH